MAVDIRIIGLEEVIETFEKLSDAKNLGAAMDKVCAVVERSAKQKAPKDTGALRRSITSKVEQGNDSVVGTVFTPLEYAPYIEYGTGLFAENGGRQDVPWNYKDDEGHWHSTSGMKPRPYMRPALDENKDQILRSIKEAILNK